MNTPPRPALDPDISIPFDYCPAEMFDPDGERRRAITAFAACHGLALGAGYHHCGQDLVLSVPLERAGPVLAAFSAEVGFRNPHTSYADAVVVFDAGGLDPLLVGRLRVLARTCAFELDLVEDDWDA